MHPRQTALAVGLCAHDGTQLFAVSFRSYAALQERCAQTPCGGSHMYTQKRRSQSLGGIHKSDSALQGRCAQTPCVGSQMHTQRRRSQSHGGIPKHILPTRDDVHRHRVVAATCTLIGEDRNRLVAFTSTYAAQQGRCAQTPYGGSRTRTQRRRSQSHGAVPKWLIRLANPLRFSGPARPRDDKKNKR